MTDFPNQTPPPNPNPGDRSGDPLNDYTIGSAMGMAASNGFTRVGLFLATNLAVIAMLTVIAALLGIDPASIGGLALMGLVFGMGGAFVSLMMSKSMAKRSTGAHVIETPNGEVETWLVDTVRQLTTQAGIGMPEVAIFPSEAPNAFATGAKRDDALVAVSVGLMRTMDRREIRAVLAHEVAHIANGDMVTLTLIQGVMNSLVIIVSRVIAGFFRDNRGVYFMAVMGLQMGLGFLASIITMWFSRRREFRADAGSAALVGPQDMIAALAALKGGVTQPMPTEVAALGISGGGRGGFGALFASHPSLDDRIAALQNPR